MLPRGTVLALATAVAFAGCAAHGQDVSISVADTTDLVLPGVAVEERDAVGGDEVAFTDGTGQYSYSCLAPGTAPTRLVDVAVGDVADRNTPVRAPRGWTRTCLSSFTTSPLTAGGAASGQDLSP